ncbi:hypothetical protein ACFLV3_04810 [Chloroflexota bacterium]
MENDELITTSQSLDMREQLETIPPDEYSKAYGEELSKTLDLDTWHTNDDFVGFYAQLEEEIKEAVQREDEMRGRIRKIIFPQLKNRNGAPSNSGVYQSTADQIERVHRGYLFNGSVEACDGNSIPHDTLPLTIVQIGVSLVSYNGSQGAWVHRLFRRDLRVGGSDPVEDTLNLLERRQHRTGYDQESSRDRLTSLGRRGIMAYAERAVLLKRSNAPWRMGHGNPAPYELLTGSGMVELVDKGLDILNELILNHERFVFIPSAPSDRMLLTIGNALRPMEYAIVETLEDNLRRIAEGHYRGPWLKVKPRIEQFVKEAGPKIVKGVFRATPISPVTVFYAHVDHAHEAAHIAIADSNLQEHRGFPMLITLADTMCSTMFGTDSLVPQVQVAYGEAGAPFQYQTERQTRR